MQFKIVALSLLASLVAAETVQELTAELPSCAVTCINKAAQEENCAADDQQCKCKNAAKIMDPAFECAADTCTANELDGKSFPSRNPPSPSPGGGGLPSLPVTVANVDSAAQ